MNSSHELVSFMQLVLQLAYIILSICIQTYDVTGLNFSLRYQQFQLVVSKSEYTSPSNATGSSGMRTKKFKADRSTLRTKIIGPS